MHRWLFEKEHKSTKGNTLVGHSLGGALASLATD
ncbi:lipase family protein [Vibrio parahaemolyticus]|nr:hypothetical protein [Vibrio parahaemolyticus]ELB2054590.1 hypothetical protein [Vibrio parahaemolyticus]HCG9188147.1 hypothetical protein [Vibrio parahaemolyticus]HCG9189400.1 hypothetical protein [Vibrio parahaemolyticus]